MRLEATHTISPLSPGRIIEIETRKAVTRMWKYIGVTEEVNDANQLKMKISSEFELNPQSILYNLVVTKFKVPFSKTNSELEFFWDKKNKNVLLNKFYAKANVTIKTYIDR